MLDSPDQNMVCRSNTDHPRIHLDVSLFSGIHQLRIPTIAFDPSMQSDTSCYKHQIPLVAFHLSRLINGQNSLYAQYRK